MTLSAGCRVWHSCVFVTWMMLMTASSVFAQATSTFNGRVLDQGDAVLPGVTVTAINANTGVARTTVTNGEGVYCMPGLEPGVYDVKTELQGFAPGGAESRDAGDQHDPHARLQARRGRRAGDAHRDGRCPADRGDAVEVRVHHRNEGAPESADDHAQHQRDAGAAAGRDADDADPSDQAECRERLLRRELGHERERRPSTAPTTATTARADR